ncbi:MAG: DUF3006 domain-containing protein [Syntrophomonadaceae bacterium]|nr:DUF3006 domain-containing protein [Syntrophomonadaceae bacterium]
MFIIDRFEEGWAVIEAQQLAQNTFNLPRALIPAEAKEGDVLDIIITINQTATASRKQYLKQLTNELFKD